MTALLPFVLGRNVSAMTITSQTPNATTGVLTAGTAQSIVGQYKTFKLPQSNSLEDVSASSARARNMMITDTGTKCEIGGITLIGTNVVEIMIQTIDYVSVVLTRGTNVITVFGIVESFTSEITGKGQVTWTLSLGEIDISSQNPTFA